MCVYTVYFRVAWAGLGWSVSSSTPFVIFFSGERQREEHNQCGCAKASFTLAIINLCQSERWRRRRQWPFYDPQHGTELLNSSSSSRPGLVQRKSADLCVLRGFFLLRFLPIVKVAEFCGLISATKVVIIAACNSGAGVIK